MLDNRERLDSLTDGCQIEHPVNSRNTVQPDCSHRTRQIGLRPILERRVLSNLPANNAVAENVAIEPLQPRDGKGDCYPHGGDQPCGPRARRAGLKLAYAWGKPT